MPTPLLISKTSSADFSMVDNCSGMKLAANAKCNVGIIFTPQTPGAQFFHLAMEYGSNKVELPILNTEVIVPISQIKAAIGTALPPSIFSNTSYPVSFIFTNTGSSTVSSIVISPNGTNSPVYTQSTNTCGATLAAGASCTVSGTFAATATSGSVQVGVTMTSSDGTASVQTISVINNSSGLSRTITFINNCAFPVSFGFNAGAVAGAPACNPGPCPTGSVCNPSSHVCFYIAPVPANGQYSLSANGGTNSVIITDVPTLPSIWSGGVAGRTGCPVSGPCETADCGSNGANNPCPVGQGFANPATLAEFTFERGIIDTYDITAINGTNVGIAMGPTGNIPASSSPYYCGNPGGAVANNPSMGNCNWDLASFTPLPNSSYTYVKDTTGVPCSTTAPDCNGNPGTVCGISFNPVGATLSKKCGQLLGFLTANQVCSFANTNSSSTNPGNNPGDPFFDCDAAIPTPPNSLGAYSKWAMMACVTPNGNLSTLNTCYHNYGGTVDDCCGCIDWWTVGGINVPPSPVTTSCGSNTSTFWNSTVQPTIAWLKQACPTMYVYPFDDKSSTFTCDNLSTNPQNSVNYTITFCPA